MAVAALFTQPTVGMIQISFSYSCPAIFPAVARNREKLPDGQDFHGLPEGKGGGLVGIVSMSPRPVFRFAV